MEEFKLVKSSHGGKSKMSKEYIPKDPECGKKIKSSLPEPPMEETYNG